MRHHSRGLSSRAAAVAHHLGHGQRAALLLHAAGPDGSAVNVPVPRDSILHPAIVAGGRQWTNLVLEGGAHDCRHCGTVILTSCRQRGRSTAQVCVRLFWKLFPVLLSRECNSNRGSSSLDHVVKYY